MKKWYSIAARASTNAPAEISIFDEIGSWGVTARDFIAELRSLDTTAITLSINSPGGSVFDAIAMYNALRQHPAKVTTKVMGVAASAASLVAMAGNTIVMPENAFMMVHNPINFAYGNAEDLREMADLLDKLSASLVATYVARTGRSEDEIKALLAAETWMSAAEAVEQGFADQIEPALRIAASFDLERIPENVRASIALEAAPAPATDPAPAAGPAPAPEPAAPAALASRIHASAIASGLGDYADVFALHCATFEDAREAIAAAREVKALCEVARMPEMSAQFIRNRVALAEARAQVIAALAAAVPNVAGGTEPESYQVPVARGAGGGAPQPASAAAGRLDLNTIYTARQAAHPPA